MHWTVILAGLVYGWRGGFISGFLSPVISFLITGMPYPAALIPMTAELSAYGISSGFLREKLHLNSFASVAVALIFGRAVYLLIYFMFSSGSGYSEYIFTAMVPGLAGGIMQIAILPLAAKLWIK
jgi:niacin transporter